MKIQGTIKRRRRRGLFLLELLGILVIMGAASILAGELFIVSLRTMRQTHDRDTLIIRVDSAVDALRRDAWAANSTRLAGDARPETGVQFRLPAGDVVWQMNGQTLTRTDAAGTRKWIGLPAFQFATGAGGVKVEVESGPPGQTKKESLLLATPRTGGKV